MYGMNDIKYVLYTGAVLIGLLLWVGCTRDESDPDPSGDTALVSFTLDIAGAKIPEVSTTRSMANGNDDIVRELDLLLFDATKTKPTLLERFSFSSADFTQTGTTLTFKAKMNTRTESTLIMVVANAKELLNSLSWIDVGAEKSGIVGSLILRHTGTDPDGWKWNAASDDSFTPIPMYGEKEVSAISPAMATITDLSLTRMLARIDVKNTAIDDFTLKRIHLVNPYISGFVTPPFDTDGGIHPDWEPYTIAEDKRTGSANALSYGDGVTAITNYEGEIYAFESLRADFSDEDGRINAACLILEGEYQGETYFYRVDFTEYKESADPANVAYLPLKRNYKYTVNITAVDGIGYTDMDKAIESYTMISNMKTRIISYDQSSLGSIVYNGQYMLGLGTDRATLSGGTYRYWGTPVLTDNPSGWTATIEEGADWLVFTYWGPPNYDTESNPAILTGVANDIWREISFKAVPADVPYTGAAPRTGKIKIVTNDNRLVHYVNITQNPLVVDEPTITFLDEYGDELPISEYYTDGSGTFPVYQVSFGLHIGETRVPPQRIYVKTTGNVYETCFGGFPAEWISNPPPASVIYNTSANNASPYPVNEDWEHDFHWNYDVAYSFTESLKGYDIELTPRSVGEESGEFKDRDLFIVRRSDNDYVGVRAYLEIVQSDWVQISDLKSYILGNVADAITIKASAPWRIKSITENRTDGPAFTVGQRNLFAASWNSTLLGAAPNPYLAVGATGGNSATSLSPVSNTFSLLTEKWQENRRGNVTIVFEATDGSGLPDKTVAFEVAEKHLDYTYEEGGVNTTNSPFFYVFPLNLLSNQYVYSSGNPTYANVCAAIGSGWRLPTLNEMLMISSYRQALLTSDTAYDAAGLEGTYHPYGFSSQIYWTSSRLGTATSYYGSLLTYGYGNTATPESSETYGIRCVYTPKPPAAYNPSDPNVPNPSAGKRVYPRIDDSDTANGPIIVSRESNTGVNTYSILPSGGSTSGNFMNLETNRVAAKLQVANQDESSYGSWSTAKTKCEAKGGGNAGWRLPTHREIALIMAVGGAVPQSDLGLTNVYSLGNITSSDGFTPLAVGSYWTQTEELNGTIDSAWSLALRNMSFWLPAKSYAEIDMFTRCVRTVD